MEVIQSIAEYVALFLEGVAVLVIIIGAVQSLVIYALRSLAKRADLITQMQSRFKLGLSLSLGLGFLVGADVIKTAILPTWTEIGQLAAIVAIRIVLNFFLMRDMRIIEEKKKLLQGKKVENGDFQDDKDFALQALLFYEADK